MNWGRLVAIILGAGVVTSLTDWFFAIGFIDVIPIPKSGVKVSKGERLL